MNGDRAHFTLLLTAVDGGRANGEAGLLCRERMEKDKKFINSSTFFKILFHWFFLILFSLICISFYHSFEYAHFFA